MTSVPIAASDSRSASSKTVASALPTDKTAAEAGLPFSTTEEACLLELCRSLKESDPEAAFRAGLARWGFDRPSLAAAAEALVKKDPAAARRLLAECPDLRSKSVLESEIKADEVSRDPEEKLRWTEANLQGYVRIRAMIAGIHSLAVKNPAAALEILAEWPPSSMKLGGQFKALGARMQEDPTAALTWAAENVDPSEKGFAGIQACMNFIKLNPTQGAAILPTLPREYQERMGFAMVWQAKMGSDHALQPMMEAVRKLPQEIQLPVIRLWAEELRNNLGPTQNQFLAALTDPVERITAIESMAAGHLSSYGNEASRPKVLEWMSQLIGPQEKEAAARVLPYLTDLTESQLGEIQAKLQ